jgi:NADPH:quinone reductase-like Zn-dependent oxidoreductase
MKAYHIDRFGSVGGIVRRSSEDPRPGPKEVLMRVRASSLNYRDLMVLRQGKGRRFLHMYPTRLDGSTILLSCARRTAVKTERA